MAYPNKFPKRTVKEWLTYWQGREKAGTAGEQASMRESNRVRNVANSKGVDPWAESKALFGCIFEALSSGASRALADWIESDVFVSAVSVKCAFCDSKTDAKTSRRTCNYCATDTEAA
jgi:hypothetical protein